ncbi:MAG: DUF5916 domain-containing protein [candidate division KSB1 bacterium]|nr:DUF5916 domain-containing protein [candidate division KSB1 bacterium]
MGLRLNRQGVAAVLVAVSLIMLALASVDGFAREQRKQLKALYIGKQTPASGTPETAVQFASGSAPSALRTMDDHRNGRSPENRTDRDALQPPKIDGLLTDPVWRLAPVASGFTQRDPKEGEPATEPTEVRVLYDDDYLYIGFKCYDREPDRIVARQMRNDADLENDDYIRILLDTYLDRRNAFAFQTNPLGARWDAQITDEGRSINRDWNCVWEVQAQITDEGWEAELRIPLNQLRFPAGGDVSTWGINFARVIRRKREDTYWSPILRDYGFGSRAFYRISKAGDLVGLDHLTRRPRLEIRPYSLSGLQKTITDPPVKAERVLDFGLDVKYGLSADLIADITINTDFAQVEADQERVNLTRFSLFFPEKRDFFLEGAGIFRVGQGDRPGRRTPNEQLFYSRRIGLHNGKEVPIIAGTKVTGNLAGLEIGLLDVMTDRFVSDDTELPRTNFSVLRLRRPVMERSSIGMMVMSKDAIGSSDFNRTFVADGVFAFGPATNISAWIAKTRTPGIHNRDWAGNFNFNYRSDRYTFRVNYTEVQENFNAEMGFIRRKDIRRFNAEAGKGVRPSWNWLRRLYSGAYIQYLTDGQNVLQTRDVGLRTFIQFESGHILFSNPKVQYELLDFDWEIHPGIVIPAGIYKFVAYDFFFRSDASRQLSVRLGGNLGEFFSGTRFGGNLNLNYRPSPHFSLDLSYNGNIVNLPTGEFTTNVLSTRITYTLSRDMFAKAYIQWNDSAELLSLNFLYNWYYRPGSNFYLVYNHRWDAGDRIATMDRALIIKVTYWLNL